MKIIKDFILREIAGEYVLVPTGETAQTFNGMLTLSPSAAFIWEHLEKVNSLEEMISSILDEFEIDETTARTETIGFITSLLQAGLIDCTRDDRKW